jgi:hypothetical protein
VALGFHEPARTANSMGFGKTFGPRSLFNTGENRPAFPPAAAIYNEHSFKLNVIDEFAGRIGCKLDDQTDCTVTSAGAWLEAIGALSDHHFFPGGVVQKRVTVFEIAHFQLELAAYRAMQSEKTHELVQQVDDDESLSLPGSRATWNIAREPGVPPAASCSSCVKGPWPACAAKFTALRHWALGVGDSSWTPATAALASCLFSSNFESRQRWRSCAPPVATSSADATTTAARATPGPGAGSAAADFPVSTVVRMACSAARIRAVVRLLWCVRIRSTVASIADERRRWKRAPRYLPNKTRGRAGVRPGSKAVYV